MFVLNNVWYWISCGREGISSEHSQVVKKVCMVSVLLISTVSCWASQISGSKKDQEELSDTCHSGEPTTTVTVALLQHAGELIWSDVLQPDNLWLNCQYPSGSENNIIGTLYSEVYACKVPWIPAVSNLCGKRCVQICFPSMRLIMKVFCLGS
jgi:hypothetical protein